VVPFVSREPGRVADRDPPVATVDVPLAPEQVPTGMVLVVPGSQPVDYRGPPFGPATVVPVAVHAFLMDRVETTNQEWARFLDAVETDAERARLVPEHHFQADPDRPRRFLPLPGTADLPVVSISGNDALRYAAWRSRHDGAVVRLPTEAEWAAAAGILLGHLLPGGSDGDPSDADYAGPIRAAERVREHDLSPYGVRGMLGNARELVTELGVDPKTVSFLSKGAAVDDLPIESAIRRIRHVDASARDPRTGVRFVREIR
jgi:formylglycine-generating enzyme required for sulfatase activity